MRIFSPYTWSYESIQPQYSKSFFNDVVDALSQIRDKLGHLASEKSKAKGLAATMTLRRYYPDKKARTKLMKPLSAAIYKHTNIVIENYFLIISTQPNAHFGSDPFSLFLKLSEPTKISRFFTQQLFGNAEKFDQVLTLMSQVHRIANNLDRNVGKLRKSMHIPGEVALYSGFLDAVMEEHLPIDIVAETIVHEVGHAIDSIDSALRITAMSELGDDIVGYADRAVTPNDAIKMLHAVQSGIKKCNLPSDLRRKYISAAESLLKAKNTDDDQWLSTVTALYAMAVREIEANIGSGRFLQNSIVDGVLSDDFFRGKERRADKFAALHGASDEIVAMCDFFLDTARVAQFSRAPQQAVEGSLQDAWKLLRSNYADYDTFANRAQEALRIKYTMLNDLSKEGGNTKMVRDYISAIKIMQEAINRMRLRESQWEEQYRFLDNVQKYAQRALTIFMSRDRLSQNSVLMNSIRNFSRSSLHNDAERLRLGE